LFLFIGGLQNMALEQFNLFRPKSKEQRENEEKEYAAWAFPYGEMQKDRLSALLKELIPKSSSPLNLFSFLTCKELYEKTFEASESREDTIIKFMNAIKSQKQMIKKSEIPIYLALVIADAEIDENCDYPTADTMRLRIQEIEELKTGKNR